MTKLTHKIVLATLALASVAAPDADARIRQNLRPQEGFTFMPEAKAPAGLFTSALQSEKKGCAMKKAAPIAVLEGTDETGMLNAPDGSTWFYTGNYIIEEIKHEYYTERVKKGFEYTIYDQNLKVLGTVRDLLPLREGQTRIAQIELCSQVTKKFANSDNKYEVAVAVSANSSKTGSDYFTESYTNFYSIGGQKTEEGNDKCILSIDGYPVNYLNAATDKWSENFYFSFLEEITPDQDFDPDSDDFNEAYDKFIMAHIQKASIYKWAGWGNAEKVGEFNIPRACMPGDGSNAPFMMSKMADGKAVFLLQYYEKSLFVNKMPDLSGETSEDLTPDNRLLLETYTFDNPSSKSMTKLGETAIECTTSDNGYRFFSVGGLRYTDDFDMANYGASGNMPGFLVTVNDYSFGGSDEYINSYYVYNPAGERIKTIFENSENYINLEPTAGFEAQSIFIQLTPQGYTFTCVDLPSGNLVQTLPQVIDGEAITASISRYPVGDDYQYVIVLAQDELGNDLNSYKKIAWVDRSASIVNIDRIKLGQHVPAAQVYLGEEALSPYFFNTDDAREYMVLLKRYNDYEGGSTDTSEEFHVISTDGRTLLSGNPEAGQLASIIPIVGTPSRLNLVYNKDNAFVQEIYDLPLEKFAGGEGTPENPYLIATAGDLRLIADNPAAHYAIIDNIDASGLNFTPIEQFTGSLDGRGHTISNLSIASGKQIALFASTGENARIVDLNITNATVDASDSQIAAVLVAQAGQTNTISGINIHGVSATGENAALFGTVVGRAVGGAAISLCSVTGTDIILPGAMAAGIVGETRTGATIDACAFDGVIEAEEAAGIVGDLHADSHLVNCHATVEIYAATSVGGIAVTSARGLIDRNYAEGFICLMPEETPESAALNLGGVVAYLSPDWEQTATTPVVSNNIVNLEMLVDVDESADVKAHRIVGRTIVDQIDPEGEKTFDPEKCLAGNFACGDVFDSAIGEENSASTEGATIDPEDLTAEKFSELGFAFGNSVEAPWAVNGVAVALFFERAYMLLTPEISVVAGETFSVDMLLIKNPDITVEEFIEDFLCDFNEEHLEMTGNAYINDGVISIEFKALKIANSTIAITYGGTSCAVAVTSTSGIDGNIVGTSETIRISFDGTNVTAAGCEIEIFSLQGVAMARGLESVATDNLATGLYIVLARDNDGNTATRKISVR